MPSSGFLPPSFKGRGAGGARSASPRRQFGVALLGLLALVVIVLGMMAVIPPDTTDLASHPRPAASYAEAVQRVADLQAREATGYNPLCKTQLLTYGHQTARVIAFAHGYGDCPQMFTQLAQQFYALGDNVLVVPLPHHGLADRLTDDLTHLTAEELVAYADQIVDIERGLGDRVSLVGLSAGGVATAWAAQTRPDLDQAVVIAPAFGLKLIPHPLTKLVTNAALLLPDAFMWWNPLLKDQFTPLYAYPRYSRRGLAQVVRTGFAVSDQARRTRPAAGSVLVITNANDQAVDNAAVAQVAADWRAHGADVSTYEFPADWQLPHNLVDPGETGQRVDVVYPKLIDLIGH